MSLRRFVRPILIAAAIYGGATVLGELGIRHFERARVMLVLASAQKDVIETYRDLKDALHVGSGVHGAGRDFIGVFRRFLDNWSGTDNRRYLVLDRTGGILASSLALPAKSAREIGLDPAVFPTDESLTFHAQVVGTPSWCRAGNFDGIRFVTVLPKTEFDDRKLILRVLIHAILLFILFILGTIFVFVDRQQRFIATMRRKEDERRQADLEMARSIQRSALPSVFPPYPRDLTIDLHATMEPARDVGGDFYDFHYVGPGRLAVLVADVSGKGVPAAMFMMRAKTVLHDLLMSVTDLGEAIAQANDMLCEGNETDMFATCWVGVLDEASGTLKYVNAGHNPPYLLRGDGNLQALESVSGMFLGGMSARPYAVFETQLHPNDVLFLFTDGVTEANDATGAMFGEARLEAFLRVGRTERPVCEICVDVRRRVAEFVGAAPQFDDITMLALRYRGQPAVTRLTVPVSLESVPVLNAFAEKRLDEEGCPSDAKADLLVALDEVANNVASYSGGTRMTLEIEVARQPSVIRFRILDDGTAWNPLDHLDPDISLSADERAIGGLGILMVKHLTDDVSYARRDGRNILAFRKRMGEARNRF